MTPEDVRGLYVYNQWANRRVLDACALLTPDQFLREIASSFSSVRDTLAHIYGAEWIWYERLMGRWPQQGLPAGKDFPDMVTLRAKLEYQDNVFLEYTAKLTPAELANGFFYKTSAGKEMSNPLWQILLHLANHSTYHRGQITTLLRQVGAKPVSTDMIAFYREQSIPASAYFCPARAPLETIRAVEWMKQVARLAQGEGRIVGFVPTMGALHEGHLSLVRAATAECQPVVVSIFVNPSQFAPGEDFEKYPRAFDADQKALESAAVDYLFAPEVAELYPPGFCTWVNVEGISERLEGRLRPGHFRGVATIVLKLLQIVQPRKAFFGRKDAQQARLIQQMARDLHLDAEIAVCPIVREADGLALSSRNVYLNPEERRAATVLSRTLDRARQAIQRGERDAARLAARMREEIGREPLARLDYAEIVDAETFEPLTLLRGTCYALLAARFGTTRLIDNLLIEENSGVLRASL